MEMKFKISNIDIFMMKHFTMFEFLLKHLTHYISLQIKINFKNNVIDKFTIYIHKLIDKS